MARHTNSKGRGKKVRRKCPSGLRFAQSNCPGKSDAAAGDLSFWFFRIGLARNAHCALGNETTAIEFFREDYDAYREFSNRRATMAMVHLFEGDREKAFALASAPLAEDLTPTRITGIVFATASAPAYDSTHTVSPVPLADTGLARAGRRLLAARAVRKIGLERLLSPTMRRIASGGPRPKPVVHTCINNRPVLPEVVDHTGRKLTSDNAPFGRH